MSSLSLPKLLARERGERNPSELAPLTAEQIAAWAKAHHKRAGAWPHEDSGPIPDAPGETWYNVNAALSQGCRSLPGGDSLAKLIGRTFNVRNQATTPRLTVRQILTWADEHRARTGKWPRTDSGPVEGVGGESWPEIDNALRRGTRGFKGGSSLYRVLKLYRRIPGRRTKLVRDVQAFGGRGRKPRGIRRETEDRAAAVELRQQGLTFPEIAGPLGVTPQRAEQLVRTSEERPELGRRKSARGRLR